MFKNEVLFIYVSGFAEANFEYSLGVGYIQAYLKSKGIGSLQFECRQPCSLKALLDQILSLEIPVVGFTCYETNYPYIFMLANALKKRKKDILIIVGGPSPTFADKIILGDCKSIDICVRGEGEYTVYEILTAIKEERPLTEVKGISYRSNGRLIRTPERELISSGVSGAELDIIPSPYLSGIILPEEALKNSMTGLVTSRGCPYKCIYCNFSIIGRHTVRFHSVERVVEELKLLWEAAKTSGNLWGTIPIYDDTFTICPERTKEICKKILKARMVGLNMMAETRGDSLDFETIDLLHRAGLKELGIGLESAVPRLLNRMQKVRVGQQGKKDNYAAERKFIARVREVVEYGKKIGIKMRINMLQGLPGESYAEVRETINFIKSLGIDSVLQNSLYVFPGTELFINSHKYGFDLKKLRRGSLHFTIKNPPHSIHYPMGFPYNQEGRFLSRMLPCAFRIFSHTLRPVTNGLLYEIVIVKSRHFPYNLLSWLNKEGSPDAIVSFLNDSFTEKEIEENFASILEHGFLATPILYFIENSSAAGCRTLVLRVEHSKFDWDCVNVSLQPSKFHFIPLSLYHRVNTLLLPNKRRHNYIIFTIESEADIKKLTEIARSLETKGKFVISKSLSRFVPSFEDECRWSDMLCPAFGLSKVVIDGEGRISPCLKGKAVGKVGEGIDKIRSRLNALIERETVLRGCKHCDLQKHCSKCLFPYPVDRERYCQIRRNHSNIHEVVSMMKIPRSVLRYSLQEFNPQRLVFMSRKIRETKERDTGRYEQSVCPPELLSLCNILKELRSHRDDILFFQWGKRHFIGFRRHRYFNCMQEALDIHIVSSQFAEVASELLLGRSVEEALLCLEKKYQLHKEGKESIGQLLKFIRSTFDRILAQ